jgi:hypothetical protein
MAPVLLFLFLSLAGCAGGMKISVDYDKENDFTGYRTWDWMTERPGTSNDPRVDHPEVRERIMAVIQEEFIAHGYLRETGNPDFLINYHAALGNQLNVTGINSMYGYPYTFGGWMTVTSTQSYEWQKGSLILDILDAESKVMVWRGSAEADINVDLPPEARKPQIHEAVQRMLERFPPR